jgi:hypothetical protein
MMRTFAALTLVIATAGGAEAGNVIREWGGHTLHSDYEIGP